MADAIPGLRRRIGGGLSLAAVALLAGTAGAPAPGASAAAPAFGFQPSGIAGGGFQNTVAFAPAQSGAPGVVLTGGDVSGVHRSTDGGVHWTPANTGLGRPPMGQASLGVASLVWSQQTGSTTVYALLGNGPGGLGVSTDAGVTWQVATDPLLAVTAGGSTHPRPTGNLIALDEADGLATVGTSGKGLVQCALPPAPTACINPPVLAPAGETLTGQTISSLVPDPVTPGTVYAAVTAGSNPGPGLYRVDGVASTYPTGSGVTAGAFTFAGTAPAGGPQEIVAVDEAGVTAVYAAWGAGGIFRCDPVALTCSSASSGLDLASSLWVALDARYDSGAGATLLYAACQSAGSGSAPASVVVSADSGATWQASATSGTISTAIAGDGTTWWLSAHFAQFMLGARAYVPAQVAMDTADPTRVLVAGRSGLWLGQSGASGQSWAPAVSGLSPSIDRAVAALAGGPAADSDVDWETLGSPSDLLSGVSELVPPGGHLPNGQPSGSSSFAVAFDTVTGALLTAVGSSGSPGTSDAVWRLDRPFGPSPAWTNELLPTGRRPIGLSVSYQGGQRVVAVAVDGGSKAGAVLVRRGLTGTWTQATISCGCTPLRNVAGKKVDMWTSPTGVLYVLDPSSQRLLAGSLTGSRVTMATVWKATQPFNLRHTGDLAGDPTTPNRVYVSAGSAALVLTCSATACTGVPLTAAPGETAVAAPGPVAVDATGRVYVARLATAVDPVSGQALGPALLRATAPGATTLEAVDDPGYDAQALFPYALTIAPDGRVLVATDGDGVAVGTPTG